MAAEPIVVEQTYNSSVAAVWKAITDAEQMRQWFFEPMADFEPTVGFETEFDVEHEGVVYRHQWKVTEVIPRKRIAYEWRYRGFQGESLAVWELSETDEGTRLTVAHHGQETFPQDNPIFSRESGLAGWEYLLHESLKDFLEEQDA